MKKTIVRIFLGLVIGLSSCGDDCKDVECYNGGTCDEGTCICPDGYVGSDCSKAVNEAFLGDWELPCEGDINITGVGSQEIPEFSSTITLEDNGDPSEISLDFTIPLVNMEVNLVGVVDGNEIKFEEQEIEIPQQVLDLLLDQLGGGLPIPISSLSIKINGEGTLDGDTLYVDITIKDSTGFLLNGSIECVGIRL